MDLDVFKQQWRKVRAFFTPEQQAKTKITLDPSKGDIALLVIDVQKEFADPAEGRGNRETKKISKRIRSLAPAFRAASIPTYAVYFADSPKPLQDIDFYQYRPREEDILVAKNRDSAFQGSNIKDILKRDKRKTLLVCGFNLNACVYRTVLDARENGFKVLLLDDLTGNDNNNDPQYTQSRVKEMKDKGVEFCNALDLLQTIGALQKDAPLSTVSPQFSRPTRNAPKR